MSIVIIFALLFSVCHANNLFTENKPSHWCNLPYGYVEQSPVRGFILMEQLTLELQEVWKDINGFHGLYQVSNLGRVKRLPATIKRTRGKPYVHKGGILSPAIMWNGYLMVNLNDLENKKSITIHRLVAKAFLQNPHNKLCVNHIDSNKANNRVTNLEWATYKENINHSFEKGTHQRGEKANNASISELVAISIKQKHAETGYGAHRLKRHFFPDLKVCLLQGIISGETWKHIKIEENGS